MKRLLKKKILPMNLNFWIKVIERQGYTYTNFNRKTNTMYFVEVR